MFVIRDIKKLRSKLIRFSHRKVRFEKRKKLRSSRRKNRLFFMLKLSPSARFLKSKIIFNSWLPLRNRKGDRRDRTTVERSRQRKVRNFRRGNPFHVRLKLASIENSILLGNKEKFNLGYMRSLVFRDKRGRSRFKSLEKARKTTTFLNTFSLGKTVLKKKGSYSLVKNICFYSGRTRSVSRSYGLSRMFIRRFGHRGFLPGVRHSSW
jgi:ribosomal protein S14